MSDERTIAGRYRLLERVGSGAMGTVSRAFDQTLRRTVAVKQVHVPGGLTGKQNDELVRRTMREGRIAARLHHPQLITVYDVVEDGGRPYLIMEYFPSRSLKAVGTLPWASAAWIGAQAAEALASAHASGVVHRDVKPANILVGEDAAVKITDFGVSRVVEDLTATMTGMFAGTPAYLAPEVAKGGQATFASDVYSLGATLYAVIEGAPPSGDDANPMGLLYRVASGEINEPRQAGPLTDVLLWLLNADPDARPTMAQASKALATNATKPTSTIATTGGPASEWRSVPPPEPEREAPEAETKALEPVSPPTEPAPKTEAHPEASAAGVAAASTSRPDGTAGTPASSATQPGPSAGADPSTARRDPTTHTEPGALAPPATQADPTTSTNSADSPAAARAASSATPPEAASTARRDPTTHTEPTTDSAAGILATPASTNPTDSPSTSPAASPATPPEAASTTRPEPPTHTDSAAGALPTPATQHDPTTSTNPATSSAPGASPAGPAPSKRSRARVIGVAAGLVVVAVVAALATAFLNRDDSPNPVAQPDRTTSTTTTTTEKPAPTTTTTTTTTTTPPNTTQQPPAQQPPSSPAAAITDYYAMMPGDLDQAWTRLTSRFQNGHAGGRSGFANWWGKISSVQVSGVTQTSANVVEATVLYNFKDGHGTEERHLYTLVNANGTWLIDAQDVLSSRTV